jgi:hypothetical protein
MPKPLIRSAGHRVVFIGSRRDTDVRTKNRLLGTLSIATEALQAVREDHRLATELINDLEVIRKAQRLEPQTEISLMQENVQKVAMVVERVSSVVRSFALELPITDASKPDLSEIERLEDELDLLYRNISDESLADE